jgi:hypothetical protein
MYARNGLRKFFFLSQMNNPSNDPLPKIPTLLTYNCDFKYRINLTKEIKSNFA